MSLQFWDSRYQQNILAYGNSPNEFLVKSAKYLRPGSRILAAGDGEGRNGIWLAGKGLEVWAVDFSRIGLKKAKKLAVSHGCKIRFICADLSEWKWPPDFFQVIVVIFVHFPPGQREQIHHAMISSLMPGGMVILQCFHQDQLKYDSGGPREVEMLYTLEMLKDDFRGMKFIHWEESETDLQEGNFHAGKAAVINAVIQKS
jgi:2-polyprenyl-3-methyl-5-hydroxy-6-metoxy-1,4-benzoquinol methylase